MIRLAGWFVCVAGLVSGAHAAIEVEAEVGGISNNTVGTAQAIPSGSFTTPVPSTVFDPPGWATATILGTGGGADVDFYSFSTTGGGVLFDIDDASSDFLSILALFDGNGTLIALAALNPPDPGSLFIFDAFIGHINLAAGNYFIAVSQYNNFPTALYSVAAFTNLTRPDGAYGGSLVDGGAPFDDSSYSLSGDDGSFDYSLHISIEGVGGVVPEFQSLAVWGLLSGVAAFVAGHKWRGKRECR